MTTEAKPELPAHPDWITQATVTGRAHATCERGAECRAEKNPAATLGRCLLLTFPFIERKRAARGREAENVLWKMPGPAQWCGMHSLRRGASPSELAISERFATCVC